MSEFPFTVDLDVRFRDADAAGHVNNAVYATYVEQARIEYLRELLGESLTRGESVLAHLEIDYERSIELDTGTVTVAVRTTNVGTTSIAMEYEVRADGGVVARAEAVLVTTDEEGPTPVPEEWRRAIETFEGD